MLIKSMNSQLHYYICSGVCQISERGKETERDGGERETEREREREREKERKRKKP